MSDATTRKRKPTGTVFIVFGTSGQYEDRSEWNVAAYMDEATAKRHEELAQAEERRLSEWFSEGGNWEYRGEKNCPFNVYDPEHKGEAGRADYGVTPVPVFETVPTVKPMRLPATREETP